MNPRAVMGVTGLLLYVTAVFLAMPLALAAWEADPGGVAAYASGVAVCLALAVLLRILGGRAAQALHRKDALGVVALIWILLGPVGGLPLWIDGAVPDAASAIFEAVSGFTTTGATVVGDVDSLGRATNLWRCLMHWVGGMGIVVLFVAVFPQLGVGARHLFKTEVPGLPGEGLKPRIRETATALWWIYLGLTLACTALLRLEGMSLYDAVCHAFSALGTGGFSTRTASVGAWSSPWIHWTLALFMLAAGLNFGLYHALALGRWRAVLRDAELRFYLLANLGFTVVVAWSIRDRAHGLEATVREAAFQVLSVTTTTGFMTADFDSYPDLSRQLLLFAMFMGGCAGSTAGGLKAVRVLVLAAVARRELRLSAEPQTVQAIRLGGQVVPEGIVGAVFVFATTFFGLFGLSALALSAMGLDLMAATSAAVACLSSIGPGLARVGPTQSYGFIPGAGKLVLSLCMLAGRLEIFALFAILTPEAWRR